MSQRSPRTTNWKAVETAYQSTDITVQRTVQEIWRASANDDNGLANSLGSSIVAKCVDIVRKAQSASEVALEVSRIVAASGQASMAADIARRAAIISFGESDRTRSYVKSVFTEASNYLVSRDISGYVGIGERLKNIQDAIAMKRSIMNEVASRVDSMPIPSKGLGQPKNWNNFVGIVIEKLIEG